ncbi:MAG: beta-ketoacyl-ACP synthase II [Planctomycetes bacterium]|nr:beta-ketoacyl-ACP synthase II [Planctomycetota bacterium]
MRRRVVITGVGLLNACGNDAESVWRSCVEGRSGIGRITRFDAERLEFPCLVAGEIKGFVPEQWVEAKEVKKLDLSTLYGLAASDMAWKDAGLEPGKHDPDRSGVILGTGIGGLDTIENTHTTIMEKGPQRVSPFFVPKMMANSVAGNVSIRFDLRGPSFITASACASSNHAMALAARSIRDGEADVVVTGGTEATITSMGMAGFNSMRAMSRRCNHEPAKASRPFDKLRDGFVMGEGAGVLIFEDLEHARRRGARIYAEMLGAGMSADAYHMTAPSPGGTGPARAMSLALKDAGLAPTDVQYVNAHGTSTELNDACETQAIKSVFGAHAYKLAISSSKSLFGHLLGASGGAEAVMCVLTLRDQTIHPTINQDEKDPELDLDYVPNVARKATVEAVLSNSLGFGGHNVTVCFRRFTG